MTASESSTAITGCVGESTATPRRLDQMCQLSKSPPAPFHCPTLLPAAPTTGAAERAAAASHFSSRYAPQVDNGLPAASLKPTTPATVPRQSERETRPDCSERKTSRAQRGADDDGGGSSSNRSPEIDPPHVAYLVIRRTPDLSFLRRAPRLPSAIGCDEWLPSR